MTNSTSAISSNSALSGTNIPLQSTRTSSTSEIISSFKEILSIMKTMSSVSATSQPMDTGISQLMAPIMLLLVERLISQQLDQDASTANTQPYAPATVTGEASLTQDQGSKPIPSGRPVAGGRISQEAHSGHMALDIAVPMGTTVKTTMDGNVVHAGWNNQGYGNLVIVENGAYRTYYAHLSSIPVAVGDAVKAGTTIGLSGNTGNSTGPHLHYEIRKNKVQTDPTSATLGTG